MRWTVFFSGMNGLEYLGASKAQTPEEAVVDLCPEGLWGRFVVQADPVVVDVTEIGVEDETRPGDIG